MAWTFFHKLGSPRYFYKISAKFIPWLSLIAILLFAYGLMGGLYFAPPDFQQGDAFRIIYVHVPCAFMSLGVYTFMTAVAITAFVWKMKMADVMIKVSAPIGAWFTFLALVTGSLWGKPMWGTYWVWDARLTSELILLFIYFALIALQSAIADRNVADRAIRVLVMVGFVNIPIIHYSVYWWNTLHQGDTIKFMSKSTIAPSMLHPLIAMIIAFMFYFAIVIILRARNEIIDREAKTKWVKEIMAS